MAACPTPCILLRISAPRARAFVWMDRHLDSTRAGPRYLAREPIAQAVLTALDHGVRLGHFDLGAWAIMPNHVHLLLLPRLAPSQLLKSLKGSSARHANLLLARTGECFWQAESYDHWVRDEAEWQRIASYIEQNSVRAGLAAHPSDYRWSSAFSSRPIVDTSVGPSVDTSVDAAGTSACATAWAIGRSRQATGSGLVPNAHSS